MLISGGVDSSVALRLLKEDKSNEITAFYIKIWMEDKFSFLGKCPWQEDLKYVEEVCAELNIPLEIVNLQKEYWQQVVSEAVKEVKRGRTPNPDILCNSRVKFGVFYDYFGKNFDQVATGHYAQVYPLCPRCEIGDISPLARGRRYLLKKSPDPVKDQTYFLALLSQEQLAKALFPIGHLTKKKVRALAKKFDLPNKDRHDSQGICFLGKIKYRDFLQEHLGVKKGDIINVENGKKMGKHHGFWYYTIGQRKDIKLSGGPWYVTAKDVKKNIIYIAHSNILAGKARDEFVLGEARWIAGIKPDKKNLQVKIRHGEKIYQCQIKYLKNKIEVKLDQADTGVAAGQYAVFYDGEVCLGGGVIQ